MKPITSSDNTAVLVLDIEVIQKNKQNHKNFTYKVCKEPMKTEIIVFFFPKNFYLISEINKKLAIFKSSGLMQFWISQFLDYRFYDYKNPKKGPQQLRINHLLGTFAVFLSGCIVAVAVFFTEICFHYFKR